MKAIFIITAALTLSACAVIRNPARPTDGIARVNPASVAANPAAWDGRQVEMVGLLVWQFENLGLYQSYGAYCRGAENAAIYVNWRKWPGVTRADSRRRVMVRGTFRNLQGGPTLISNAAPGPGPLEPGSVVRWLSKPQPPCPRTR